jgi:hypothetical protein
MTWPSCWCCTALQVVLGLALLAGAYWVESAAYASRQAAFARTEALYSAQVARQRERERHQRRRLPGVVAI